MINTHKYNEGSSPASSIWGSHFFPFNWCRFPSIFLVWLVRKNGCPHYNLRNFLYIVLMADFGNSIFLHKWSKLVFKIITNGENRFLTAGQTNKKWLGFSLTFYVFYELLVSITKCGIFKKPNIFISDCSIRIQMLGMQK